MAAVLPERGDPAEALATAAAHLKLPEHLKPARAVNDEHNPMPTSILDPVDPKPEPEPEHAKPTKAVQARGYIPDYVKILSAKPVNQESAPYWADTYGGMPGAMCEDLGLDT